MDLREKFSLAFLYFLSLVLIFLHEKKRNEKKILSSSHPG